MQTDCQRLLRFENFVQARIHKRSHVVRRSRRNSGGELKLGGGRVLFAPRIFAAQRCLTLYQHYAEITSKWTPSKGARPRYHTA
jgi:hypothetical protein